MSPQYRRPSVALHFTWTREPEAVARVLVEAHGEHDAARTLARVIGAVCAHGEEAVEAAIMAALAAERTDLLSLTTVPAERPQRNAVPDSLAGYKVEEARAADYDQLLAAAHA